MLSKRRSDAEPGVDEEQVEGVELGLHPRGEGVDVRQRPRVARNHEGVLANLFLRRFQAGLRPPRHQNTRTPIEEHLRRGEPHAAGAADNNCDFVLKCIHFNYFLLICFVAVATIYRENRTRQTILLHSIQNLVNWWYGANIGI